MAILSPLVGKTEHFVKNSIQFVTKIEELEIPPGRKMVSFDVTVLFTSIPVTEAVSVIKDRLNQDTKLKDRLNKIAIPNNKFQMASGQGSYWLIESPTIFSSMCSPPLSDIYQFYF